MIVVVVAQICARRLRPSWTGERAGLLLLLCWRSFLLHDLDQMLQLSSSVSGRFLRWLREHERVSLAAILFAVIDEILDPALLAVVRVASDDRQLSFLVSRQSTDFDLRFGKLAPHVVRHFQDSVEAAILHHWEDVYFDVTGKGDCLLFIRIFHLEWESGGRSRESQVKNRKILYGSLLRISPIRKLSRMRL